MPSTVINTIRYDAAKELLTVEFLSGRVYHYKNVPLSVYSAFRSARSKGAYFNAQVKDKFAFERGNAPSRTGDKSNPSE